MNRARGTTDSREKSGSRATESGNRLTYSRARLTCPPWHFRLAKAINRVLGRGGFHLIEWAERTGALAFIEKLVRPMDLSTDLLGDVMVDDADDD